MSTSRGVFEGADDEVRYIAANEQLKEAGWADARPDGRTDAELKVSKGRPGETYVAGWLAGLGERGVINKSLRALDTQGCMRINI